MQVYPRKVLYHLYNDNVGNEMLINIKLPRNVKTGLSCYQVKLSFF